MNIKSQRFGTCFPEFLILIPPKEQPGRSSEFPPETSKM